MENGAKDTRNNRLRKTNADSKCHRFGRDKFYMEKHLTAVQRSKESVAQNIENLKRREQNDCITIDEIYKLVAWNKKAENIANTEERLTNDLYLRRY